MKTPINRRQFIKGAVTASVFPLILPSQVWSAKSKPSNTIGMGFIGMGKMNRGLLRGFMGSKSVRALAVCDVDTTRRENAKQTVDEKYKNNDCAAYNDFRELLARDDIDAVTVATPDHWHATITIAALKAGKDVYCEKPLTHNIYESVSVIAAVDKYNRVLQTGSMQRSMPGFREACELVLNGHIGKLERVICSFGDPGKPCDLPEEKMEPGLDWDTWVGPAQLRPYNSILSPRGIHSNFPKWRRYKEFGGGAVCDWGAHHLDIAQWGLGMDNSGPVAALPPEKKGDKRGAQLVYANGVTVTHGKGIGSQFIGSEGEVQVGRGRISFTQNGKLIAKFLKREDKSLGIALKVIREHLGENPKVKLYKCSNHKEDFLNAVRQRTKPISHESVGGRSAICCHLINQVYYNHEKIKWDPENFKFTGGTGDPSWLTRDYRKWAS